jgi:hypothetical protein
VGDFMECYICKRTEDEFKKIFLDKLASLEEEKSLLEDKIDKIKEIYAKENGFTDESKNILKKIDKKFLELKFHSYLENEKVFDELDENLILLKNYYINYRPQIKEYNGITINDILEQFLLEPFEDRYERIKKEIEKKISDINPYIEKINETKSFFFEIDVGLNSLYHELVSERYDRTSYYRDLEPNIYKYTLPNKIYLCPYCAAMLKEASTATFTLKIKKKKKKRDDDWD